jgi:hypothetical protein
MSKVNPKKRWPDYRRTKGAKEFISELSEQTGIPVSSLIISDNLGKMSERGTWVQYNMLKGTKAFIKELVLITRIPVNRIIESILRIRRMVLIQSKTGENSPRFTC